MNIINQIVEINLNYIILGLIMVFFTLEQIANTPFKFGKRIPHLFQNILFQVVYLILNIFFVTFQVYCIAWLNKHHVGLLYLVNLPLGLTLFIGVALYDVTAYWIHRGTHKIPLLWRFHRVHHSETTMDSSTVFRFHPIELILVFGMGNILTALIFGTDLLSLGLYYLILYIFFFFEHSNLNYPKWLDSALGWILVTPNIHKVHHEKDQYYTDSNYADIFILWDRLFSTYKYLPISKIRYGLIEFDDDKKQTFWYLFKSPFLTIKRIPSKNKRIK